MPQIFKALATIMVWILWVSGLVMGFSTLIMGIIGGDLFNAAKPVPMAYPAMFAVALAFGIGALVAMKIRKSLE
jgi:hypothetical protein